MCKFYIYTHPWYFIFAPTTCQEDFTLRHTQSDLKALNKMQKDCNLKDVGRAHRTIYLFKHYKALLLTGFQPTLWGLVIRPGIGPLSIKISPLHCGEITRISQGYKDLEYQDTRIQAYKNTGIQEFQIWIPRYKGLEIRMIFPTFNLINNLKIKVCYLLKTPVGHTMNPLTRLSVSIEMIPFHRSAYLTFWPSETEALQQNIHCHHQHISRFSFIKATKATT